MYGWGGEIIYVDLTEGKVSKKPLPKGLREGFLGARGVNVKLLWDLTEPGIDPQSPENNLIFGVGPLTGTPAPTSGRTTITAKSPTTNLYVKSSMGGAFSGALKFAGYDNVVLRGRSEEAAFLWIDDGRVELRDAEHLWGLDVRKTDEAIKRELGDREIRVSCIGPAGENLVKSAAVICSVYNAGARSGIGAVMGSKNLKAVAVRGTGAVRVKDPRRLTEVVLPVLERLRVRPSPYGTSGLINMLNEAHTLPVRNFTDGHLDDGYRISGEYFVEGGYRSRRIGCFSCIRGCHIYTEVKEGPYSCHSGGPEYETCFALGSCTGVTETEALLKANELCNLMGLDTISVGVVIAWAMESYEKGALTEEETDGLDLRFGSGEALVSLIPMIARRKGEIGALLAEGARRAAEKIGKGSWRWALVNSKGLEISGVDTRTFKTRALSYSVNPKGPDHLIHQVSNVPEVVMEATGDADYRPPTTARQDAQITAWYADRYAVTDALGLCSFTGDVIHTNAEVMAEMYSAVTGIEVSSKELMTIGRRIYTLERCYNIREGLDRRLDDLPPRMIYEPVTWEIPRGVSSLRRGWQAEKGAINDPEGLNEQLDEYYRLMGWDLETGYPLRETLRELGLEDTIAQLEKVVGRLP
jgi:aldehyde:ferredoxin oxidoreductase